MTFPLFALILPLIILINQKFCNFILVPQTAPQRYRFLVPRKNKFQTSNPMYFAGGDAINGGAEVVNAAYDGKMAALGIHNWLKK